MIKSIFSGIILGLSVIAAGLFSPNVMDVYQSFIHRAGELKGTFVQRWQEMAHRPDTDAGVGRVPTEIMAGETEKASGPDTIEPGSADDTIVLGSEAASEPISDSEVFKQKTDESKYSEEDIRKFPFWAFDKCANAEGFIRRVSEESGVELHLSRENYRYVVYLSARDEQEKVEKAKKIKSVTGITVN